jgi:hypothetical protein
VARVREFGSFGTRSQWFRAVNWIDVILACVLALFGLRGFFRGFFRELFSLLGLIAGFILAVEFAQPAATYAAQWWKLSPLVLKGGTFIAIFFVAYFAFNLIGWLLHRSESLLFIKSLNRAWGFLFAQRRLNFQGQHGNFSRFVSVAATVPIRRGNHSYWQATGSDSPELGRGDPHAPALSSS